jgi:hypothetical protein
MDIIERLLRQQCQDEFAKPTACRCHGVEANVLFAVIPIGQPMNPCLAACCPRVSLVVMRSYAARHLWVWRVWDGQAWQADDADSRVAAAWLEQLRVEGILGDGEIPPFIPEVGGPGAELDIWAFHVLNRSVSVTEAARLEDETRRQRCRRQNDPGWEPWPYTPLAVLRSL